MRGAGDEEHLALAAREGRIIFTQDADFLRMHASDHSHRGIVFAPQQVPTGSIVRGLMLIYEILRPEDMAGRVEFL